MYFKLVDEKERIMLTLLHQGDLLHLILRNGFLIATQSLAINFLQQQKKRTKKKRESREIGGVCTLVQRNLIPQ